MTTGTVGGNLGVALTLPAFSVTTSAPSTLGSGQQYISKVPVSGPGYPGVIVLHGLNETETAITDTADPLSRITTAVAAAGFPVIALRAAGNSWGNNASRTAVAEGAAFLVSNLGADPDLNVILARSHGVAVGLSYVSDDHQAETLCVVGIAGALDMGWYYANIGTTSIDAAFAAQGGWPSSAAAHDPALLADAGAFDEVPMDLWQGTSDEFVPNGSVTAFLADVPSATNHPVAATHFAVNGNVYDVEVVNAIAKRWPATAGMRTLVSV